MAISFESDEEVLRKLRERLRRMSDEELIKFGKQVRKLAENPFQRQLEGNQVRVSRQSRRKLNALDGGVKQRVSHPRPPFNPVRRLISKLN